MMKGILPSFRYLSLDQKILTLILINVIGFCLAIFIVYTQTRNIGNENKKMANVSISLFKHIESINIQTQHQRFDANSILSSYKNNSKISNSLPSVKQSHFLAANKQLQEQISLAEKFTQKLLSQESDLKTNPYLYDTDLEQGFKEIRNTSHTYNQQVISVLRLMDNNTLKTDRKLLSKISKNEEQMIAAMQQLIATKEKMKTSFTNHASYVQRTAIGLIILTVLIGIVFFITTILLIIRRSIVKPIQLLTDTINAFTALHKIEEPAFEKDIIKRQDELGRMARSFKRLKHDLWAQGQTLENAKNEAVRANRAKSVFLASASHDLRQPLNAMQMYIAALQLKIKDEATHKIVKDIEAVAFSTAQLLNALLDVSQLEAGAITPQIQNFPIQDILTRLHQSFTPLALEKGLKLEFVSSSAFVTSDPILLEQIIGNFTSNAIRYTEKGKILIGCRRKGDDISIEVIDMGSGIPTNQIMPVFDDFYQIHNHERDRGKGLGLGLAIAKRLAECLNHELECDSRVDKGSRFSVLVKRCAPIDIQTTNPLLDQIPTPANNACILLIEDNIDVLKATTQLLLSWGYKVLSGRDMEMVLQILDEQTNLSPDIILADYRLPGEANGVEVATKVQEKLERSIPTIIITGDMEADHLQNISNQGYPVLHKPVRPAQLRAYLSYLMTPEVPNNT